MNRYFVAPGILHIIGLPMWIKPSSLVGVVALVSGLFCLAGVLRCSLNVTLVGCVLALLDLSLSLWWSASSTSIFGAVAFGLALLFLLDTVHLAPRFEGAQVDRAVWQSQVAWWIVRAAISCGAAIVLMLSASAIGVVLSSFGRPIIAGAGTLAAFVAVLLASLRESGGREGRPTRASD